MLEQVSKNAWINRQGYQGETRNPNGQALEAELSKHRGKTAAQCREELRAMGALDPDAARARAWGKFSKSEKTVLLDAAGLSTLRNWCAWDDFNATEKDRLWNAIRRAGSWGDWVREASQ